MLTLTHAPVTHTLEAGRINRDAVVSCCWLTLAPFQHALIRLIPATLVSRCWLTTLAFWWHRPCAYWFTGVDAGLWCFPERIESGNNVVLPEISESIPVDAGLCWRDAESIDTFVNVNYCGWRQHWSSFTKATEGRINTGFMLVWLMLPATLANG